MGRSGARVVVAAVLLVSASSCARDAGVDAGSASAMTSPGGSTETTVPSVPAPQSPPTSIPVETGPDTTSPTVTTVTTGTTGTTGTTIAETESDAPTSPTPGDGLGDTPFPEIGNPGIDVTHYDVDVTWDPTAREITGVITIDIDPTEDRPAFTLDASAPLAIVGVTVDGAPAEFRHEAPELRITPAQPLTEGVDIEVAITYHVVPEPESGVGLLPGGWLVTDIGSYTINEPDLARTWMPCNDHPSDKATWDFRITVPAGMTAVANGVPIADGGGVQPVGTSSAVWRWRMAQPMATYLVQVLTGSYEIVEGVGPGDLRNISAVLPQDRDKVQPYLDQIGPMIDYFDDLFGPYPFDTYGLAVADSIPGLAMEEQTRSLFPRQIFQGGSDEERQFFLSHELAHQWFGDAVTPASWQDIWLNESFATYGQWLWAEHLGFATVEQSAGGALNGRRSVEPSQPGDELFGYEVYEGGAVVLHALRLTIGDEAFFSLLRSWVAENLGESRTTADFIALAERVAGRSLTVLFDEWLFTTDPPSAFP